MFESPYKIYLGTEASGKLIFARKRIIFNRKNNITCEYSTRYFNISEIIITLVFIFRYSNFISTKTFKNLYF